MPVTVDRRYLVRGTNARGIAKEAVKRARAGNHELPHKFTVAGIEVVVIDLTQRKERQ